MCRHEEGKYSSMDKTKIGINVETYWKNEETEWKTQIIEHTEN